MSYYWGKKKIVGGVKAHMVICYRLIHFNVPGAIWFQCIFLFEWLSVGAKQLLLYTT